MKLEKAILGAVIYDKSIHDLIIPQLRLEYFGSHYRYLADILITMYQNNEAIDLITVSNKVGLDGQVTPLEISQICDMISNTNHIGSYVKMLRDDYLRRMLGAWHDVELGKDVDPDDYITEYIEKLEKLRGEAMDEYKDLATVILENDKPESSGIKVDISKLNKLDPFKPGHLVVLAARPSHGKTNLGLDITRCACQHGKRVLFFSLEMTINELVKRLTNGTPAEEVSMWNLKILDKAGVGMDYIKAHSRIVKPDLIVVDYLGLVKLPYGEKRTYQIGEVTREIKALAKELGCSILLIAQANRKIEDRSPKLHQMDDLADSADIERDADMVMFTMRYELWNIPEYRDGSSTSGTNLIQIVKNRHGDIDMFVAERDVFIFRDFEPLF